MMKRPLAFAFALMLGPQACTPKPAPAAVDAATVTAEPRPSVQVARSPAGMVVCDAPLASRIGAEVLRDGGNAVDAAVATALALAVTWPEAGNLGGGGFMLIARPDRDGLRTPPVCIDYREKAPAAATADLYTPGENRHHARHVGVPGTVAGLYAAHEQFGLLPWARLVTPAARLARAGFPVDAHLAGSINRVLERLGEDDPAQVAELRRVFGRPGGGAWRPGDTLTQPDLADTLDAIAAGGADAFYLGPNARRFAEAMAEAGGLITAGDLADYRAIGRDAIHTRFRGHDVYGAPPPSSGGITVGLILGMLEPFGLRDHPRDSPRNLHLITEAMRRAFHQRALYLGDPDFVQIPAELLRPEAAARRLAGTIDPGRATASATLQPGIELADESPDTTHLSVVDADGLAVANTTTLEQAWGSRVVVPGLGFVLNNEMGDFNWVPGRTTRGGAIGTPANTIAPGKRMLSSMSPTVVMRDGRVVLVTGSPGGRTIINTVAGIVLDVTEFGMPVDEAVQRHRMHHAWFPDALRLEAGDGESRELAAWGGVIPKLRAMGHTVGLDAGHQGSAHSIAVEPDGLLVGVADYRRGGLAATPSDE